MVVVAVLLGLAVAVSVNALADDLPPDETGRRGRVRAPHCRTCGLARPAEHWLALGHALLCGGRCPYCAAPRRRRDLVVEMSLAAGFAYLWAWSGGDGARFLAAALVIGIFAVITVIDLEHRLILWRVVWVSALALAALGAVMPDRGWQKTLLGGAAGYGLVLVLFLLGQLYAWAQARLRGRPLDEVAFGGGDVNLAGLIGLAVGWSGVLFALFLGVAAAGVYSLGVLAAQAARGRYNPHMPFAYGPFLVFGALVIYLHGREFAAWWFGAR